MFPRKTEKQFFSQGHLIFKAYKLQAELRNGFVEPGDMPFAIIRLNRLFANILDNDGKMLQKLLSSAKTGELTKDMVQVLLTVGRLQECMKSGGGYYGKLRTDKDPVSLRINAAIVYLRERDMYVAAARQYLIDLRKDIHDTGYLKYETDVPEPIMQMIVMFNVLGTLGRKPMLEILQAYHQIMCQLNLLAGVEISDEKTSEFFERQCNRIIALKYQAIAVDAPENSVRVGMR